jgi:hypothetical protein
MHLLGPDRRAGQVRFCGDVQRPLPGALADSSIHNLQEVPATALLVCMHVQLDVSVG